MEIMLMLNIYHNPRCSKSRRVLQILRDHGCEPNVILYTQKSIGHDRLRRLISKLGIPASALLRRSEPLYKELDLSSPSLQDADMIDSMVKHPQLIERPIIERNERAVIARPPEKALDLL